MTSLKTNVSISSFVLLMCCAFFAQSQVEKSDLPLSISVLDESLTLPNFKFLGYSYNPALIIGTEYALKEKEKSSTFLKFQIGGYHHKDWQTAIFINSEFTYRRQFNRLYATAGAGLGYAHIFENKAIYSPTESGFAEQTNLGNPTLMPSVSLGLGYQLKDEPYSPELFLTFSAAADVPFDIFTGLHQLVGVGYKFYPFQ